MAAHLACSCYLQARIAITLVPPGWLLLHCARCGVDPVHAWNAVPSAANVPAVADFAPPAPDVHSHGALLSLWEQPAVGRAASTLLEVLRANVTRRSPRASTLRDFPAFQQLARAVPSAESYVTLYHPVLVALGQLSESIGSALVR